MISAYKFADQMKPKDLVAVHMTDYFPANGTIRTLNDIFPQDTLRNTVHFAINHPVSSHTEGNWNNRGYGILAPLEDLCKSNPGSIENFNSVDTFFLGNTHLPEGTTVLACPSPENIATLVSQQIFNEQEVKAFLSGNLDDQIHRYKKGTKYVLLGPHNKGLKQEVISEMKGEDFRYMAGGESYWVGSDIGNTFAGTMRIAREIQASTTTTHICTKHNAIENRSHILADARVGGRRRHIDSYLTEKGYKISDELHLIRGQALQEWEIKHTPKGSIDEGRRLLYSEAGIKGDLEKLTDLVIANPTYHNIAMSFLRGNMEGFKEFIPSEVWTETELESAFKEAIRHISAKTKYSP